MQISPSFPAKDSTIMLAGAAGSLELLVSPSKLTSTDNDKIKNITTEEIIAIICHPHPLHQGTMNNKVVYTTHAALSSLGCHTVRFNFRGVGKSAGMHDHGIGETEDLITIIKWVKTLKPECKLILAGFSFGAFIALKASKIFECLTLISIAPAVSNQDYQSALPVPCPWLILQGEDDEIIPPKMVFNLVDELLVTNLEYPLRLIKFPNVGHFFHGALTDLKAEIINYLTTII